MGNHKDHKYKDGDSATCSVCNRALNVKLFPGRMGVRDISEAADHVLLCDTCGKVFCVTCAVRILNSHRGMPTGTAECNACRGGIGVPFGKETAKPITPVIAAVDPQRLQSDEVPPSSHQQMVHRTAKEYLNAFLKLDVDALKGLLARFQEDRLLGLEITDEAFVLYKNEPDTWPLSAQGVAMMTSHWQRHYSEIVQMRGGRSRQTTTPTLRGGGKRAPGW